MHQKPNANNKRTDLFILKSEIQQMTCCTLYEYCVPLLSSITTTSLLKENYSKHFQNISTSRGNGF